MKTRKRTVSAASNSCVPANVKQESASESLCSPTHLFLRQHGYVQAPISDNTGGALAVAVKAFEAQLEVLDKQQPQHRHAGYKQLGTKQRLEFCSDDSTLGQLGMLQGIATTVVQAFDDIAREQLEGVAKSLQLPAAAFLPVLDSTALNIRKQSASSLEAIHYMVPEAATTDMGPSEACEAHEDKGLLTLIYADTQQGLQVQGPDGSWRHLLIPQGQIAVLAGYTLERATCGLIKAAKHRVVVGGVGNCPTARTALVYKLRAPDTALLDLHAALCKHHQHTITARYQSPIGVGELMHFFDATHTSVNALPALASENVRQPIAKRIKKSKTELEPPPPPQIANPEGIRMQLEVETVAGHSVQFIVRPNTPLQKVFDTFCLRLGISLSDGKFLYCGDILCGYQTPESKGMEPGDSILWHPTQLGD